MARSGSGRGGDLDAPRAGRRGEEDQQALALLGDRVTIDGRDRPERRDPEGGGVASRAAAQVAATRPSMMTAPLRWLELPELAPSRQRAHEVNA